MEKLTKSFHDPTNYHNKPLIAALSSKFEHVSGGNYSERGGQSRFENNSIWNLQKRESRCC